MIEAAKCVHDDTALESAPAGVHDRQGRRYLVDQEEGNAIGHEHRNGELVAIVNNDVACAVRRCFIGGDHVGAVGLIAR